MLSPAGTTGSAGAGAANATASNKRKFEAIESDHPNPIKVEMVDAYPHPESNNGVESEPNAVAATREGLGIPAFRGHVMEVEYYHSDVLVLTVAFLTSKSTVFDLISSLFAFYLSDKRGGETMHSHLWSLRYRNKNSNLTFVCDGHYASSSKNSITCDEMAPYPLSNFLELKVGDKMNFEYDMGSTTRVRFKVSAMKPAAAEDEAAAYPRLVNRGRPIPADGFLSDAEKAFARTVRAVNESSGAMEWSRRQQRYIKATPPAWTQSEKEAIVFLIYAGVKFTKAWNMYLQYSILSRSKATTSGKWYELKKDVEELDALHREKRWLFDGSRYTDQQCLQRALSIMRSIHEREVANRDEHGRSTLPPKTKPERRGFDCSNSDDSFDDELAW